MDGVVYAADGEDTILIPAQLFVTEAIHGSGRHRNLVLKKQACRLPYITVHLCIASDTPIFL